MSLFRIAVPGRTLAITSIAAALCFAGSCSKPEVAAAKYLQRGKARMERKDYTRAALELKNAVRLAPKNAEARYQLGLAQLAIGDFRGAVDSFRRAVELDPRHTNARVRLAGILAAAGDKEAIQQAEDIAKRGLEITGDNADLMSALAVAEARLGRPEEAEKRFQETLDRFPAHLGAIAGAARMRLARNDIPGAEAVLKKAADLKPPVVPAVVALAELYTLTNRYTEADARFGQALQMEPSSAPALIGLAGLRARQGKREEAESILKRVSALGEGRFRLLYPAFLYGSGKVDQAIAEFRRLLASNPRDREARTQLAGALAHAGRAAEAGALLDEALKSNAKDREALLQRAVLSLAAGKREAAQRDLDQLMRLDNDLPEAHYLQGWLYGERGEFSRAEQEFSEAIKINPGFAAARLQLAELMLRQNKPRSALTVLDAAPEAQRDSAAFLVKRNWALLQAGDMDGARKGLVALKESGGSAEVLTQEGVLKLKAGDHAGARAALDTALRNNPADARAADLLVFSYVSKGEAAAGVEKIGAYAAKAPESAPMQFVLGKALAAAGRAQDARKAFERASALRPQYAAPQFALAELDLRDHAPDSARKRLQAIAASNPRSTAAHLMLGQLEESTGNTSSAIEEFRKVMDLDPNNAAGANNLAYLLVNSGGNIDEALKFAQQAKRLAPENAAVDDTIGWALYNKGLFASAVQYLEPAAAQGPAIRKYHLAMAYFKAGEKTRARMTLDAALRIDPNLPEAEMARQLIAGPGERGTGAPASRAR